MKNLMAPVVPLAIVIFAAVAAVALQAAAERLEPRRVSGPEPGPECPSGPANAVERTQHIFHELHADGRNAACTVCDSQYRSA
jgi:hypothetical protein